MGETTETSWKAGLALVIFLVAIMLIGWQYGGQSPKPTNVTLHCQTYGDGTYTCKDTP